MRAFFLFVLLSFPHFSFAQEDSGLAKKEQSRGEYNRTLDSQRKRFDSIYEAGIRKNNQETIDRNLQSLVQYQKQREKKQKQQAYVRIGLGILFFTVLIVGLTRKKKRNSPWI